MFIKVYKAGSTYQYAEKGKYIKENHHLKP